MVILYILLLSVFAQAGTLWTTPTVGFNQTSAGYVYWSGAGVGHELYKNTAVSKPSFMYNDSDGHTGFYNGYSVGIEGIYYPYGDGLGILLGTHYKERQVKIKYKKNIAPDDLNMSVKDKIISFPLGIRYDFDFIFIGIGTTIGRIYDTDVQFKSQGKTIDKDVKPTMDLSAYTELGLCYMINDNLKIITSVRGSWGMNRIYNEREISYNLGISKQLWNR